MTGTDTDESVFEYLFATDRAVRLHQQSAGVGAALGAVVGARRSGLLAGLGGGVGAAAGYLLAQAVVNATEPAEGAAAAGGPVRIDVDDRDGGDDEDDEE